MTTDQQPAGRTPRRFRPGPARIVRVAAVGSALCVAAGMGISMASQASAAAKPGPGGFPGHDKVLPVCISFGGILRVALPFSSCSGPVVPLEIAGDDHPLPLQPPLAPPPPPPGIFTDVHLSPAQLIPAGTTGSADAACATGEVATGGGFTVGAGAGTTWSLTQDVPTTFGAVSLGAQIPNDWLVTVRNATVTAPGVTAAPRQGVGELALQAYVVCTRAPHFHHGQRMAPARSAARH